MSYRGGHYNNGYSYPPHSSSPSSSSPPNYDYNYSNNQQRYSHNINNINNNNSNNSGYHPQGGEYSKGNGYSAKYSVNYNNGYNKGYQQEKYYGSSVHHYHQQQQQKYYASETPGYYKYPKQQYNSNLKPTSTALNRYPSKNSSLSSNIKSNNNNNNNINSNNNSNIFETSTDSMNYEPIVKSYSLNSNKQGNFISQIEESLNANLNENENGNENGINDNDNDTKSFKTVNNKLIDENKRKNTIEYVEPITNKIIDPRIENSINYSKSLSKSFFKPVNKLYIPNFKFDKYSIGDKPSNEILIWNLHSTTTSIIIKNNFSIFGPILEVKMIDDPETAVPLGMCLLSFDGKAEQAHNVALKSIDLTNKKLLIQGRYIRSGLNLKNQLYNEIYKKTMDVRNEKLRKQKLEDLKKEEQLKQDKIRKEKIAKEEERIRLLNIKRNNLNSNMIINNKLNSLSKNSNLSVHDQHIFPYSSSNIYFKLSKYIANRPFIFIDDKYVSTMHVSSDQLRRFFIRYNIKRILQQRNGFFLVFDKLFDAMKFFDNEDGKKFLNYNVFMSIYVPDNQINETRIGKKIDNIKLSQDQIMKELNAYLFKDIREKVIGDMILNILNTDEMSKIADESKKRRDEKIKQMKEEEEEREEKNIKNINIIENYKSNNNVMVIKGLDLNIVKKSVKKSFIPMSHSLNKNHDLIDDNSDESDESDESEDSENENEEDNGDDDDDDDKTIVSKVLTKEIPKTIKKRKTEIKPKVTKKKAKIIKSVQIESGSKGNAEDDDEEGEEEEEEEEDEEEEEELENKETYDIKMGTELSDITSPSEPEAKPLLTKTIDNVFQPSTSLPGPVFKDNLNDFVPTLEFFKNSIKTEQDFQILSNICKDLKFEKPIKDVKFWAWEHIESMKENKKLREEKIDDIEDIEEFDYEDEILNNKELRNLSGCFKTEGYQKIPDKFKREYLLHRRKLTNLNPVKHEDDDEVNITNHNNNVQSSRVNRANTRRFVADISAQKQIIGETDLLDLNQLNKRKKPVQFARSAIHNWGLYALEPISAGEMIIEYVGERIRQQVAEVREKKYLRSGIGSSYLFRINENTVIDASKRGGIARFINHCCEPSCTAKIIKVGGKKRIVIYALRDVKRNEELTYDYKFEREINDEERIPCLCGAPGCKGYLN